MCSTFKNLQEQNLWNPLSTHHQHLPSQQDQEKKKDN